MVGGTTVEGVVRTIAVVETGSAALGGVKVEKEVVVWIMVVGSTTAGGGDEVIGSVVIGVRLVTAAVVATQHQHTEKHRREESTDL